MKNINFITISLSILLLISCSKKKEITSNIDSKKTNWVLESELEKLNNFNTDFYSKSKIYYWVKENDTSDFRFKITELKNDKEVNINFIVNKPIEFSAITDSLKKIFPIIENDFNLKKLRYLYIGQLLLYPNLNTEVSNAYQKEFGSKNVSLAKFNKLILQEPITNSIDSLVSPFGKKVKHYSIEKFHLIDKENYHYYLKDYDYSNYPEFSIFGGGVGITLE